MQAKSYSPKSSEEDSIHGGSSVPYRKEGTMPRPTLKIIASQRDALYEQVRTHLGALNDVWIAMECNKDFATAERLAIEFGEDFRLMEDLGWNPVDDRDRVELTMAPHDLMEVTRRLREEAKGGLADARRERQATEEEKGIEVFVSARDACEAILRMLGRLHGGDLHVRRA
jgi:hypothetical protein